MSAPARRYRVADDVVEGLSGGVAGQGYDVLLGRPVSVRAVPTQRPERLARVLRMLPPSEWVQVLDALPLPGRVLVVMPEATGVLAGVGGELAPAQAQRLAAGLDTALADLADRGLVPVTVDPGEVATTAAGEALLVPGEGTSPVSAGARAALMAVVAGSSAPAPVSGALVAEAPVPVVPLPEPSLTAPTVEAPVVGVPPVEAPVLEAPTVEVPAVEAPTMQLSPVGVPTAAPSPARTTGAAPAAARGGRGSTRLPRDGVGEIAEKLQPAAAVPALGGVRQWPERLGLDEGTSVLPASRVFAAVGAVGVLGALVGVVAVLRIF